MTLKRLHIIIFSSLFLIYACNKKKADFSVKTPVGWQRLDTISKNGNKYVKLIASGLDSVPRFVNNINISVLNFRDVDYYMNAVIADVSKNAQYFREIGRGDTQVGKYRFKWEQHLIVIDKEDRQVEQKLYFLGNGGKTYMFVCSTNKGKMVVFQFTIDEILASFKIL